jgi:hypothetical protein
MRRTLTSIAAALALAPAASLAQTAVVEKSTSATLTETAKGETITEKTTTVAVVAEKKSPITFTPYGFVLLNVFRNDGPIQGDNKVYPTPLPCPAVGGANGCDQGGSYYMNIRQTRLGSRLDFDDAAGWTKAKLTGLVEVDFHGGFTGTTSDLVYNPLLRLRKAYGQAAWGGFSIRFGQDDRLVSPLRGTSLAYVADPVFQNAGLLHGRAPMLALRYDLSPKDGFAFGIAAAALNPQEATVSTVGTGNVSPGASVTFGSGNRGNMPNLEGRIGLGFRSGGKKTVDLGLWGGLQRNRFVGNASATSTAKVDVDVNSYILGADLTLNVWVLTLLGQVYQGHGYNIPGSIVGSQGIAFRTTGSGTTLAPVQPLDATAVKATGGWGQLAVNLDPVVIFGGWGGTQTPFSELTGTQLALAGNRVQNYMWAVGAMANAGKNWRFSFEYASTTSWFYSGSSAQVGQYSLNSQLVF